MNLLSEFLECGRCETTSSPEISHRPGETILKYEIDSFYTLGHAVNQVHELLRENYSRSEYHIFRREVTIAVEKDPHNPQKHIMSFILPLEISAEILL
jgi:hypothetical protein